MAYVHQCVLCGWQRPAASATVTSPRCEQCGCALEAALAANSVPLDVTPAAPRSPAPLRTGLMRLAALAGTALLLLAAARTGYAEGGLMIGAAAVGAAGLFVAMTLAAERP